MPLINLLLSLQVTLNKPIIDKPVSKPIVVKVEPPPITWADNPNHCNEDVQWISAEAPYPCIEKSPPVTESSNVADKSVQSDSTTNLYDFHSCTWWVKNNRPSIPNTWGDATDWFSNAQADGYETGSVPREGAVGWTYGHVVYVFSVHGDTITIGDGNYDYNGSYRTREASADEFSYIY